MKVTMVVPTYNDLESLRVLLDLIDEEESTLVTYLIVNNGSTNPKIEDELNRKSMFWRAFTLEENAGFGGGIIAGIQVAETEWVGWMPGNLKIQPKDVDMLVEKVDFRTNLFIKCHRRRISQTAKMKTFTAGLIQSLITWKNLFDTGGTPTICEKSFFVNLKNLPGDYIIESRILYEARLHKLLIERPVIPYGERKFGSSHWQRGLKSEVMLMKAIILDSFGARIRTRSQKNIG